MNPKSDELFGRYGNDEDSEDDSDDGSNPYCPVRTTVIEDVSPHTQTTNTRLTVRCSRIHLRRAHLRHIVSPTQRREPQSRAKRSRQRQRLEQLRSFWPGIRTGVHRLRSARPCSHEIPHPVSRRYRGVLCNRACFTRR